MLYNTKGLTVQDCPECPLYKVIMDLKELNFRIYFKRLMTKKDMFAYKRQTDFWVKWDAKKHIPISWTFPPWRTHRGQGDREKQDLSPVPVRISVISAWLSWLLF